MIQIVLGRQGSGKTKTLVEKANTLMKNAEGNIVYIDMDKSQLFSLDYQIRLIETKDFPLETGAEFFGFVCGIISQDFDLQTVFIDGLLKTARISKEKVGSLLDKVTMISEKYHIDFIISMGISKEDMPDAYKPMVIQE